MFVDRLFIQREAEKGMQYFILKRVKIPAFHASI